VLVHVSSGRKITKKIVKKHEISSKIKWHGFSGSPSINASAVVGICLLRHALFTELFSVEPFQSVTVVFSLVVSSAIVSGGHS